MGTLLDNDDVTTEYLSDEKAPRERFSVREVAEALDKAGGFVTYAARYLKCRVSTVRSYLKKYPQLNELVKDIKEFRLDTSEVQLFKKINKGDNTAIIFHLKCQGKDRGYIDNAAINYNVDLDPNKASWKDIMEHVFPNSEDSGSACDVPEEDESGE